MSLVMSVSRSPFRWRALLAGVLMSALVVSAASADEVVVVPPKRLDRKFPQFQYCALPVALAFTSPGSSVRITFDANRFIDNGSSTLQWTQQLIDNIALAPSSVVTANFGAPPTFSQSENCYLGDPEPTPYFYFDHVGVTTNLLELFNTDPTARGWDMTHGAYYSTAAGAPRNLVSDSDRAAGALGLGADSATPNLSDVATTSILVNGLTPGAAYTFTGWWSVGSLNLGEEILTITITTDSATPVARKSWGGMKATYR